MADPSSAEFQEIATTPAIEVRDVDREEFNKLKSLHNEVVSVAMDTFNESDGNIPILNEGAGPCAIIYAINKITGEAISGHYPEVSHKRDKRFLQIQLERVSALMQDNNPKLILPSQKQTDWLSDPDEIMIGYGKFEQMENRLSQLISTWGRQNIEIHLFGQNAPIFGAGVEKDQRLVDSAIEHNDLTVRIRELGIPEATIHDHRSLTENKVDNTFYDSFVHKIFHYKRPK